MSSRRAGQILRYFFQGRCLTAGRVNRRGENVRVPIIRAPGRFRAPDLAAARTNPCEIVGALQLGKCQCRERPTEPAVSARPRTSLADASGSVGKAKLLNDGQMEVRVRFARCSGWAGTSTTTRWKCAPTPCDWPTNSHDNSFSTWPSDLSTPHSHAPRHCRRRAKDVI
jgi:hypothetical protein